ncbi:MAG: glycine cleavage system aminomethyltransferase GcvT [Clostridiales bacterium]|nr:glycine cleavage system aminomethyltransferase GcvT [Clostridiales bacterium]
MKRTPLYESHIALGGKIIDFGGWALPVQYTGIINEHRAVRTAAGLFDVSHMGEILIEGNGAGEYIQKMITNDILKVAMGRAVYSPMCYENGGTVDDLLIYKLEEKKYLLVVNAANIEKDLDWLKDHCEDNNVSITDLSHKYGLLAIQGPASQEILQRLSATSLDDIRFFRFLTDIEIGGVKAIVSRTGYTGEDGFEIYIPADKAIGLWDRLLDIGADKGLIPAGLGARDTLRFEVALPLYGHELSPEISPLEAGLDRFVKLHKAGFVGRDSLLKQAESGSYRRLIGLEMVDRGIPRAGYKVFAGDREAGFITSGGMAPTLGKNLGLALIDKESAQGSEEFFVQMRGKLLRAKIVDTPFYVK